MAVELITRRVYDSQNRLVREGLVPDSVPNRKADLLRYWQEQDLAEARAAALDQLIDDPQPEGPSTEDLAADLADLDGNLQALAQRLAAVEQARLLAPDAAVKLAQDLARAELAPTALLEVADEAMGALQEVAKEAQGDLSELRALVVEAEDRLSNLEAKATTAIAGTISELQQQAREARVRDLELLSERASLIVGEKGDPGPVSPGMGIGAGVPSGPEAAVPVLGRLAIPGDTIVDGSAEERPAYRFDGQTWERGPAMSQVLVRPVSIVGRTETHVSFDPTGKPPEVSGGAEAFSPLVLTVGAGPVRTWDSSRWAGGGQEVHSALLYLEAVSTTTGAHGSVMVNATETGQGGFDVTNFAELGLFQGVIEVDVEAVMGPATPPAGAQLQPGIPQAMRVSAALVGAPGSYVVRGWALPALQALPDGSQPKPAW